MSSLLTSLFDHMTWADARVIDLLTASPEAAQASGVLRVLSHVISAERVWLQRILGRPVEHAIWPEWGLDEIRRMAAENSAQFQAIVQQLSVDEQDRVVHYRNSQGVAFQTPLRDILLHVALHGSYHRGQIAAAVRGAGFTPVNTDYIMYTREKL